MSPNKKHEKTGSDEILHSSLLFGEEGTMNAGIARRETAITALLIIGWWGFSSIWNIGAKRVLSQSDEGVTLTLMQHCIGAFMSGLWQYFFQGKSIRMLITKDTVFIAALYCIGTLALNISLITSSAAFTQNLKSIECILTGLLSRKYLKTRISRRVGFAMCLISIGAFLSSVSGVEQSFRGVLFVVVSSFALSCRNVFTKKLYKKYKESIPDLDSTFFFEMSFMAAGFLTPIWLVGTAVWKPSAADPWEICAVGMYHFLYNCLSFVVLSRVSTLTHSVCNNVKRVFVVAVSLAYFQTKNTSTVNMIGLVLCSLGVLYYAHASATGNKKVVDSGTTTGFFKSISMPKVSLKAVLQFVFLGLLAVVMLFREGVGSSPEPIAPLPHPPSIVHRSEGLENLNLMARSVNSTGIRIVMYTASGNGNLGDNIQAITNLAHFERFGILKNKNIELWSSSIQACCYTYPDVVHKFTLPARPTDADIAWMNENFSVLWIGGGGLLGYPHAPLDLNFNNWMNRITFPVVFAGLGSSTGNDEKVYRAANILLRRAVHVGVRTPEDAQDLIANGYENASYMPDPVLSDPTYVPPEVGERAVIQTMWNSTRVCWIPKGSNIEKIAQAVRPSDIIFSFEGRDGNFHGKFSQIHRVLEDGHVFSKSLDRCDLVVTMRYHGAVLAIRRLVPTIMLGSMPDPRSKHYQLATQMNLEQCHIGMDTIPDAYTFQTRFHQVRHACLQSFDPSAVLERLKEIEGQYESGFVTGLTKAFQALGIEDNTQE